MGFALIALLCPLALADDVCVSQRALLGLDPAVAVLARADAGDAAGCFADFPAFSAALDADDPPDGQRLFVVCAPTGVPA